MDTEKAGLSDMPSRLCYIIVITKIGFVYFHRGKYLRTSNVLLSRYFKRLEEWCAQVEGESVHVYTVHALCKRFSVGELSAIARCAS